MLCPGRAGSPSPPPGNHPAAPVLGRSRGGQGPHRFPQPWPPFLPPSRRTFQSHSRCLGARCRGLSPFCVELLHTADGLCPPAPPPTAWPVRPTVRLGSPPDSQSCLFGVPPLALSRRLQSTFEGAELPSVRRPRRSTAPFDPRLYGCLPRSRERTLYSWRSAPSLFGAGVADPGSVRPHAASEPAGDGGPPS